MPFYAVTFTNSDPDLRAKHLEAHVGWLNDMVESGRLRLSGPLSNGPLANSAQALLILKTESRAAVMQAIGTDPFYIHGVTNGITVTEWDPIFGVFAQESGGVSSLSASP